MLAELSLGFPVKELHSHPRGSDRPNGIGSSLPFSSACVRHLYHCITNSILYSWSFDRAVEDSGYGPWSTVSSGRIVGRLNLGATLPNVKISPCCNSHNESTSVPTLLIVHTSTLNISIIPPIYNPPEEFQTFNLGQAVSPPPTHQHSHRSPKLPGTPVGARKVPRRCGAPRPPTPTPRRRQRHGCVPDSAGCVALHIASGRLHLDCEEECRECELTFSELQSCV